MNEGWMLLARTGFVLAVMTLIGLIGGLIGGA